MPYIRNYIGSEKIANKTSHKIQFVMQKKKPMNVATVRKILRGLSTEYNTKSISIYASTITNKNIVIKTEKDEDIRSLSKKELVDRGSNVFNKVHDTSKFEAYFSITAYVRGEEEKVDKRAFQSNEDDELFMTIRHFKGSSKKKRR